MSDIDDSEKAEQTQEFANAVGEIAAVCSTGAVVFGTGLFLASYLHHHFEDDQHDEMVDEIAGVVRTLLRAIEVNESLKLN